MAFASRLAFVSLCPCDPDILQASHDACNQVLLTLSERRITSLGQKPPTFLVCSEKNVLFQETLGMTGPVTCVTPFMPGCFKTSKGLLVAISWHG